MLRRCRIAITESEIRSSSKVWDSGRFNESWDCTAVTMAATDCRAIADNAVTELGGGGARLCWRAWASFSAEVSSGSWESARREGRGSEGFREEVGWDNN
jgi:hypothetical protein